MNNNGKSNESESVPESDRPDLVSLLSGIYLEAGLPLEFAVRSAIADYELFDDETLCAL